jgi:hypothetical protein
VTASVLAKIPVGVDKAAIGVQSLRRCQVHVKGKFCAPHPVVQLCRNVDVESDCCDLVCTDVLMSTKKEQSNGGTILYGSFCRYGNNVP